MNTLKTRKLRHMDPPSHSSTRGTARNHTHTAAQRVRPIAISAATSAQDSGFELPAD